MTEFLHTHGTAHHVADAHGRTIDLTSTTPTPIHGCPCTRTPAGPQPRGRPRGAIAVRIAITLTAGLVACVLLVVIRDIVTTVASTGLTGFLLKLLLAPSPRRDQ